MARRHRGRQYRRNAQKSVNIENKGGVSGENEATAKK